MKKILVRFTTHQYNQLKEKSKLLGFSIASLVRLAVDQHFRKDNDNAY